LALKKSKQKVNGETHISAQSGGCKESKSNVSALWKKKINIGQR